MTRSRNRRGQGALLREEIVAAAGAILERTGQDEAVTLRAVAREAGITAPSIYAHFPDRLAVLMAVIERAFAELTADLLPVARAEDVPLLRLRAVCRAYLDFASARPHAYRVLFERHRLLQPASPGEVDIGSMVGAEAFGVLLDAVRDCSGTDADEASTFQAAVRLWVGLHGLATLRASLPWFPWPPTGPLVDQFVDRLVDQPTPG